MKKTLTIPAGLLCLALTAVITLQVASARTIVAPPTVVVTLDLPKVFDGLNQRADMETKLQAMRADMANEEKTRTEELKELQTRFKELPETDVAGRQKLNETVTLKALELNAWRAFANEQLDIEKSLLLRDLDQKVRVAIEELAEINGYDIVVNDDSKQKLGVDAKAKIPREIQVKQQMMTRRLLYVNPSVDITDQLIERMNNAFAAGG